MKRREYGPQDANCFLCREEPLEAYWHQMPECEIQRLSRTWFWKHYEYILVFLDKTTDEFVDQLDGFRTAKAARDCAISAGLSACQGLLIRTASQDCALAGPKP